MNNIVFITGATSGFGEATARLFFKNGYDLIITGRREDRLKKLQLELQSTTQEITTLCFDVCDENQVNLAIEKLTTEQKSRIEILVNNAGLAVGRGPIDTGISEDWERMIDTNIKGLLYVSKAIIPILKANQKGHIVNIGSIAGKEVYAGGNVYCATKHAVDALSQAMRIDLVQYGIKVTNIAPGAADTEFSIVRFKGDKQTADSVYHGFQPLMAEDIADAIFYACTRPKHVTINDLIIMPTAQASAAVVHKK